MAVVEVRFWLKVLGMHTDEAGGSSRTKTNTEKGGSVTSERGQECRERGGKVKDTERI